VNNPVVRCGYQFIDECRRRLATLKVRPYSSNGNVCEHECGAPELSRTYAAECMPSKALEAGLVPLRLIAHATRESRGPIPVHEIMTRVEQ
jgi:hypothetical protein